MKHPELDKKAIAKLLADENYLVRLEMAKMGYNLYEFANDEHFLIRLEVARKGIELEKLALDEHFLVRLEAIRQIKDIRGRYEKAGIGGDLLDTLTKLTSSNKPDYDILTNPN